MDPAEPTIEDTDVLSAVEARVVGCLVEKQATVPDSYPMTLNALRTACNQSSNRDPVVSYDDGEVLRALDSLKGRKLVRFVHAAHGARTTKYRHVLDEALGLGPAELAALSILLLRGPQTAAEVRARAERQHAFGSVGEVESVLSALAGRPRPLVGQLPREPGRREPRWGQLMTGEPSAAMLAGVTTTPAGTAAPLGPGTGPGSVATGAGTGALRDELEAVRAELADLRSRFEELCRRLGEEL